jgi:hypothetical protein
MVLNREAGQPKEIKTESDPLRTPVKLVSLYMQAQGATDKSTQTQWRKKSTRRSSRVRFQAPFVIRLSVLYGRSGLLVAACTQAIHPTSAACRM